MSSSERRQPLSATQSDPASSAVTSKAGDSSNSNNGQLSAPELPSQQQRSHSLTGERAQLQCIAEDPDNPPTSSPGQAAKQGQAGAAAGAGGQRPPLTAAQQKRATMVKKAIRYFEDKSNRSVSADNLFTRRKNLAAHLGLDEKVRPILPTVA